MWRNHQFHPGKDGSPNLGDERENNPKHFPLSSAFDPLFPPFAKPMPFHGIELQPSEVCPKNFIIFDQTDDRSQVMYHPGIASKLNSPALNVFSTTLQNGYNMADVNTFRKETSSSQEDPDEIDALLSLEKDGEEEEEDEESDEEEEEEEEVSTGRTYGNYGNNSPDSSSCSSYNRNNARKNGSSCSGSNCIEGERKRKKMKKMMRVLRGIVPGGEQLNTETVLDEAVKYLKSLKVEAENLGVGNLKD